MAVPYLCPLHIMIKIILKNNDLIFILITVYIKLLVMRLKQLIAISGLFTVNCPTPSTSPGLSLLKVNKIVTFLFEF